MCQTKLHLIKLNRNYIENVAKKNKLGLWVNGEDKAELPSTYKNKIKTQTQQQKKKKITNVA